jgi:hypothetical protein
MGALMMKVEREPMLGKRDKKEPDAAADDPEITSEEGETPDEPMSELDEAAEEFRSAMKEGSAKDLAMSLKNLMAAHEASEAKEEELHRSTEHEV